MNLDRLAAPGGGPTWPVWGQVLFGAVIAAIGLFVLAMLVKSRKGR
ncbi:MULTISPECIES: hypothetical protein [Streptomyces]|uniref:LPXTG cell wall anchor domain-containing protein n=1 Tax=Streptomyces griseosporeus TaxID=1910 RepID=A0ABV3KYW1_STRGS|nr:hypothetical protein [Streptomyces actuosus]MBM4826497.1 hypothetical protein [Streptomyces actuosus]